MIASGSSAAQSLDTSSPSKLASIHVSPARWDPARDHSNFAQWAVAMKAGRYERAWKINEQHGKRWPSAHQLWDGKSLRGRSIHLHGLHGFGDVVQMARFLPRLQRLGCELGCMVAPPLVPLMSRFAGAARKVSHKTPANTGEPAHCDIEFMELPFLLNLTVADLPVEQNYLHLPQQMLGRMAALMGPSERPRVGLVWRGGSWDPERWVPFSKLHTLFNCAAFEWWSMQGSEAAPDVRHAPVRRLDRLVPNAGLVELATALANLDLLITTDTLAAHLSGALGKPTWLLLKNDADWRWMQNVSTSPWYPSMRLFRQHVPGDWDGVLEDVRTALSSRSYTSSTV